jgi:hypothetical protein
VEIVIEEISRGHKLIGRHKFKQDSITIGRAYHNDLILSDPHVCAKHLHLNFDGENWLVQDQDSINGSYLEEPKQNLHQHKVQSGDIISLGKSQVRLVLPNHPVAQSILFSPFESVINVMRHPVALCLNIMIFAAIAGYMFYLNKPLEVSFSQFMVPAIGMTLLFALWPCAVALVSHFTKHDARIISQLGISFAFFNLMWLSDVLESIIDVNLSSNWPGAWIITLLPMVMAFFLIWLNCYIGFQMNEQRRLLVALGITALLFGGSYVITLSNKPEFSAHPQYNSSIMPPGFIFARSSNVDTFIDDSSRLFDNAQKTAKQSQEQVKK